MSETPSIGSAWRFAWTDKLRRRAKILLVGVASVGSLGALLASQFHSAGLSPAASQPGNGNLDSRRLKEGAEPSLPVDVIRPAQGGLPRNIIQTGSLEAFETAELYARVSGYLKTIKVDIGTEVSEGQVLAEIDAPELAKDVERQQALVQQAESRVLQAQARVKTAQVERQAAEGTVQQADADVLREVAERSFREKELVRFRELVSQKAIEIKILDEKQSRWEAAKAGEEYARASALIARAELLTIDSRIEQAKADLAVAEADVRVASADLARAQVMADYVQIVAPFSGRVIERNCDRGAYVHSATAKGAGKALLTIAKTDHMRVVIRVADPDVPTVRAGQVATISIDALGGETFLGTVSRVSHHQDPRTRTMRAEIDLPNLNGQLTSGMYGAVTISAPPAADSVIVPKNCLVGRSQNGRGKLYVLVDGRIQLRTVGLGHNDGERVEVLWDLSAKDLVLADGSDSRAGLRDGAAAEVVAIRETPSLLAIDEAGSTLHVSR